MFARNYGGGGHDFARFVQQTTAEGYIIAGSTESIGNGLSDFWLIKTDPEGNEEWNQTYGGVEDDWGSSAQQTSDGGYIIAGNTKSFGDGGLDFLLIKTDSEGNDEWSQTYGGEEDEETFSVQQTTDGGYIATGYTKSFGNGGYDVWLIKTDSEGNTIPFSG
ncbi:MAG: hypothetical protein MUP82_04765 [Candidatus Marinimicrobia bacterium]|nr:hypothetical protein [Candidatus Neomarinimicrobiota bacterium]